MIRICKHCEKEVETRSARLVFYCRALECRRVGNPEKRKAKHNKALRERVYFGRLTKLRNRRLRNRQSPDIHNS